MDSGPSEWVCVCSGASVLQPPGTQNPIRTVLHLGADGRASVTQQIAKTSFFFLLKLGKSTYAKVT